MNESNLDLNTLKNKKIKNPILCGIGISLIVFSFRLLIGLLIELGFM